MTEYERREYIVLYECDGDSMFDMGTKERIVRCRDCRFSRVFDGKRYPGKKYKGKTYCINWGDGMQGEWTKPDGYCHRAKRKEGGE